MLLGGNPSSTLHGGRQVYTIQSKSKVGLYSVIMKDTQKPTVLSFTYPENASYIASCLCSSKIGYVNNISPNLYSLANIVDDEEPELTGTDYFTTKYDYYQLYDMLHTYNLDLLVCNKNTDDSKFLFEGRIYNVWLKENDKVKLLNRVYNI